MVKTIPSPRAQPEDTGWFLTINPWLPRYEYYISHLMGQRSALGVWLYLTILYSVDLGGMETRTATVAVYKVVQQLTVQTCYEACEGGHRLVYFRSQRFLHVVELQFVY